MAVVQLLFGHAPADVQQAPAPVVQESELRLVGQAAAALRQRGQQRLRVGCGVGGGVCGGVCRHVCAGFVAGSVTGLVTGRGHGQQVAAQVAAVHGGHIGRRQCGQRVGVYPVHEVAALAGQAVQRVQRGLQARGHLLRGDPAQRAGAGQRQQVHADVGGRRALRHHGVRHRLHVVGRQVLGAGVDVLFKPAPGVARHAAQVGLFLPGQGRRSRWWVAGQGYPPRRGGPHTAQPQR